MAKVTREQKKLLKAVKKNPHDANALLELAWMHWHNHEYPEAKQRFTQALESQSTLQNTADASYGLALIEQHSGQDEKAQERLREIFRTCQDYAKRAEVHLTLAQVTEHLWRTTTWKNAREREQSELLQRAIDHYQQAIERRSEQQGLASLSLGRLYYELQRPENAVEYFLVCIIVKTIIVKKLYGVCNGILLYQHRAQDCHLSLKILGRHLFEVHVYVVHKSCPLSLRSARSAEATEDKMSEEVPSPPGEANL